MSSARKLKHLFQLEFSNTDPGLYAQPDYKLLICVAEIGCD